jgi:hypothetical protein
MWTEAELPDEDYAGVYGHEALQARILARLDTVFRSQEQVIAKLDLLIASSADTTGATAPATAADQ